MTGYYQASVASNIAFLKYWGKRNAALQWPANDSLSMTLSKLATRTRARCIDADDHIFYFEGRALSRHSRQFGKAFQQLDRLAALSGTGQALEISSSNNFPLGAGMASSASGLAALTLAALAAWSGSSDFPTLEAKGFPLSRLASLARLGSGSAGRSMFDGYVLWQAGETAESQAIASCFPASHWALCDSVIVFTEAEKSLSSSDAHQYAWSSPLFRPRLAGIPERLQAMQSALGQRDLASLGPLLETEALEMHAVIMTAEPAHQYLNSASLTFISDLREARRRGEIEAYFTIDAGPNIHLIHEESQHPRVRQWLETHWAEQLLLHDRVGSGPVLDYVSH